MLEMYSKILFLICVIKIHIVCDFYVIEAYYSDCTLILMNMRIG